VCDDEHTVCHVWSRLHKWTPSALCTIKLRSAETVALFFFSNKIKNSSTGRPRLDSVDPNKERKGCSHVRTIRTSFRSLSLSQLTPSFRRADYIFASLLSRRPILVGFAFLSHKVTCGCFRIVYFFIYV
jgi:hypothetical protein